jgi:hypothetical protein
MLACIAGILLSVSNGQQRLQQEGPLTNGHCRGTFVLHLRAPFPAALPQPVSDRENSPAIPTWRLLGARGERSEI